MQVRVEQIEGRRLMIEARGNQVMVDDTLEAGGPGDGFRPTELLMGALGACMTGTMINFADGLEIHVDDIMVELEDETAEKPTRIDRIRISMRLRTDADERRQETLQRVAGGCRIHNTLGNPPTIELDFQVR